MVKVLYIHGMGGGGDSRIPAVLNDFFRLKEQKIEIVVRTYDFDPEAACLQIQEWVSELKPRLVIGESLGCLHALRITGLPLILVSPALNAPFYFEMLAWLTLIPGVTRIFDRIYRPREGDRQPLHFTFTVLRKYIPHRRAALSTSRDKGDCLAFFGLRDHYRKSGIVSLRTWRKHFGSTFMLYDGTHFTEEEYILSLIVPAIYYMLDNNK